jgi:hypothetical protein
MSFNHYSNGGNSGLERKLAALAEDVRKLKVCETQTIKVEQTSRGQMLTAVIKSKPGEGSSTEIKRLRVETVENDTLTCKEWDGTTLGATVEVARVFQHRYTVFHGKTITYDDGTQMSFSFSTPTRRTKSNGTETETQEITPEYNVGFDEIYAIKMEGITGVDGVSWMDLNLDGRAWAKIA